MLTHSTLSYVAFSALFASVMFDASAPYTIAATMVFFLVVSFTGPARLARAEMKRNIPRSQYWGVILLVSLLFSVPFFEIATGVELDAVLSVLIKIIVSMAWVFLTIQFVRSIARSLLQSRA